MPQNYDYFAFGSNMSYQQVIERLGNVPVPISGKLKGYRLAFNKYSQNRSLEFDPSGETRVSAANIIYTGNTDDTVEGVVYQLTESQLTDLDKAEGYRTVRGQLSTNSKGYKRETKTLENNQTVVCYIANIHATDPDNQLKPSVKYVELFMEAGILLSPKYQQQLLNIEVVEGGTVKNHTKQIPVSSKEDEAISDQEKECLSTLKSRLQTQYSKAGLGFFCRKMPTGIKDIIDNGSSIEDIKERANQAQNRWSPFRSAAIKAELRYLSEELTLVNEVFSQ